MPQLAGRALAKPDATIRAVEFLRQIPSHPSAEKCRDLPVAPCKTEAAIRPPKISQLAGRVSAKPDAAVHAGNLRNKNLSSAR